MEYLFSKDLLLRMPVKKPQDYTADNGLFLDDLHFRAALYLASPSFFATLERQDFKAKKLTEREETTLRKYINRYCFRPTPFGLFASVSLVQWAEGSQVQDTGNSEFKAVLQADQTYQSVMGKEILDHELAKEGKFVCNPSVYRVLNELRFFRTALDENAGGREYLLQSIAFSLLLKNLANWCNKERTHKEITSYIMQAADCTLPEAMEYADFLIDAQLLVSCFRQHISGPGYLEHLLRQHQVYSSQRIRDLHVLLGKMAAQTTIDPGAIRRLDNDLKDLLPIQHSEKKIDALSAILYRPARETGPDIRHQEAIRDGIFALNALSPPDRLPALDNFVASFRQHFDGQTLSLLTALDPETGIGYQQAPPEKHNPLLETLHIPYKAKAGSSPEWTPAQSLLLKSWLRNNHGERPVIQLEEDELQSLKTTDELQLLGMSVLFRTWEDNVLIESAGGSNSPALLGRFTVVDEGIAEAARKMAAVTERQNPHLIFAELLHLSDPHVDNVNRRERIYTYELPLTASSVQHRENQLELGDLYLRIEKNKVVLFSKKWGKPVIPRLSSAYNHGLNKLPLFRFLADLSYQYGRFNLSLDVRRLFPGQGFYPRIVYRAAILSLATWIISGEDLERLQQASPAEAANLFRMLSGSMHLPVHFLLAEGDQQLIFNRDNPADVLFFCVCIRKKKEAVLKEFLTQPEIRQYNAYLLPIRPLDIPFTGDVPNSDAAKSRRKYIPGSEWLYLKLYAPRISLGRLLLRLQPLLRKRYKNGKIGKWFFIRYDDHAPHLRLRMNVAPEAINEVLIAFKAKLEDRIQQHVIREYQVDVYSRELERYAAGGIEKTEDFFWASSELVIGFIKFNRFNTAAHAHHFGIATTMIIISAFLPDLEDQLSFNLKSYQQFLPEFAEVKIKVELDKRYRELSPGILNAMSGELSALTGGTAALYRFRVTLKEIATIIGGGNGTLENYMRSIIHMHLNRVYTDEARKQEMITYYFLYKYLLSVKGQSKL